MHSNILKGILYSNLIGVVLLGALTWYKAQMDPYSDAIAIFILFLIITLATMGFVNGYYWVNQFTLKKGMLFSFVNTSVLWGLFVWLNPNTMVLSPLFLLAPPIGFWLYFKMYR